MNRYQVTLSYRKHFNSLERTETTYTLQADNKQQVLVKAGFLLCADGISHVSDSLVVKEVTRL